MSSDAIAMAVGFVLGVLGGLPTLLVFFSLGRREQEPQPPAVIYLPYEQPAGWRDVDDTRQIEVRR